MPAAVAAPAPEGPRYEEGMREFQRTTLPLLKQSRLR
jgi:hypothetical protein